MRKFAVKGVEVLKNEKKYLERDSGNASPDKPYTTYDLLCAKYYEFSVVFCLNKADRDEL